MNVLIAHAFGRPWAAEAVSLLSRLPVSVHCSRTGEEALGLASRGGLHVGIVDGDLPREGGLELVRRIRQTGSNLPCVLVCDNPNPQVLQDALRLQVFSVLLAGSRRQSIVETILKIGRQVYRLKWTEKKWVN